MTISAAEAGPATTESGGAAATAEGGAATTEDGPTTSPTAAAPASRHVGEFDRAAYQRAARTMLSNPMITTTFPDTDALPLIRRWAVPLAEEFGEQFGYRLEITATTARLIRVHDELDGSRPARTRTGRDFDRRRYAYLVLTLAALDRAGSQVALSELADRVAGEAARIDGLDLAAERASDRAAFVDAVGWLEQRGALTVADGSARNWADDPARGEALYDIDRDVARAIYRPSRVLQHLNSVTELLEKRDGAGDSANTIRRRAGQRVRRALVENPVVYYDELDPSLHGMLRSPRTIDDLTALTGASSERRGEGALLLDVSRTLTDTRFPGPGTVTQVALLLVVAMCDRIEDVDAPELPGLPVPSPASYLLAQELDDALPRSGVFQVEPGSRAPISVSTGHEDRPGDGDDGLDADSVDSSGDGSDADGDTDDGQARDDDFLDDSESVESPESPPRYPFLDDSWLRACLDGLVDRYGSTFAAKWLADPEGLLGEAVALLTKLRMIAPTTGGVLARPLIARYRNAVVDIRQRAKDDASEGLFTA